MIGNIFKKNDSTPKVGNNAQSLANLNPEDIATYITIEGDSEIRSPIEKKLTIGTQVGELVLSDSSISPRHCTFFNSNGVISVMDHSSENGTFVNKKSLDAGKVFILDIKDKIKLGNLSARLEQVANISEEVSEDSDINPDETAEMKVPAEDLSEMSLSDETAEIDTSELPASDGEMSLSLEASDDDLLELSDEDLGEDEETSLSEDDETVDEEEAVDKPKKSLFGFLKRKKKEDTEQADEEPFVQLPEEPKEKKSFFGFLKKKEENKPKVKASGGVAPSTKKAKKLVDPSANFIFRFLAHIYDALILAIVLEVFSVFTEVGDIYNTGLKKAWSLVEPHFNKHILVHLDKLIAKYPDIKTLSAPVIEDPLSFEILNFVAFFLVFRAAAGLILGVSVGELLAGIKAEGHFLLKRIMYIPRQIIGLILMPFIIFDMPCFLSKRTFKEVLTRFQFSSRSKASRVLMFFIFFPTLISLSLFSSYFKGLETLPVVSTDKINLRALVDEYTETIGIDSLNLGVNLTENFIYLPSFEMKMNAKAKKKVMYAGIVFYDQQNDSYFDIKKIKSFSFTDIYKSFVSKNWVSNIFQPELYSLTHNVALKNKNFRFKIPNKKKFFDENFLIINGAFEFDPLKAHEFVMENGPFYRAFRDLREKLTSLLSDTPHKIAIANLNEGAVIIVEHKLGRNKFYSLIPLGELQASVYKVNTNVDLMKDKLLLPHIFSFVKKDDDSGKYSNSITEFIDKSQTSLVKDQLELNQKVYETYFKTIQFALKLSNKKILAENIKQLQKFISVLELDKEVNQKLYRNLSELLKAAKENNNEFFNIQTTESV